MGVGRQRGTGWDEFVWSWLQRSGRARCATGNASRNPPGLSSESDIIAVLTTGCMAVVVLFCYCFFDFWPPVSPPAGFTNTRKRFWFQHPTDRNQNRLCAVRVEKGAVAPPDESAASGARTGSGSSVASAGSAGSSGKRAKAKAEKRASVKDEDEDEEEEEDQE